MRSNWLHGDRIVIKKRTIKCSSCIDLQQTVKKIYPRFWNGKQIFLVKGQSCGLPGYNPVSNYFQPDYKEVVVQDKQVFHMLLIKITYPDIKL